MGFIHRYQHFTFKWRKLIIAACVLMTVTTILMSCVIPHPLDTIWLFMPPVTVTSNILNGTVAVNVSLLPQMRIPWLTPVNTTPLNSMNPPDPPISELILEETERDPPLLNHSHKRERTADINKGKLNYPKHIAEPLGNAPASHPRIDRKPIRSKLEEEDPVVNSTPKMEGPEYLDKVKTDDLKYASQTLRNAMTSGPAVPSFIPTKPVWLLPPEEALAYAKKEIENAPIVADSAGLHAPLFRNLSSFQRSYELMERMLKVYIYRDGSRPIFHTPHLQGIYASEGWFMKLLQDNEHFVVKDPLKAHLFYLPYSARQLQLTLYAPNSHNLRPLSLYLRDYTNYIAAKYPFWNLTRGRDHFLVACHDWGPYTTTQHSELFANTIKALCNADLSEGIFNPSKDVSLPETTVRNPKNPLKYLGGGKPVSKRTILAFFSGSNHGRVRPILRKHWDGKDQDMKIYGRLPIRISKNMSYIEHMKSSKFCICPMGYEVNSPRIVEAIYYECVPVIIADNFVPPFNDVLDWGAFSVIVAEEDIPRLKDILLAISLRQYISLLRNLKQLQKHFLWHHQPRKYDLFHMILHSIWFSRVRQIQHE